MALFNIIQGVTSTIMQTAGFGSTEDTVLPDEIIEADVYKRQYLEGRYGAIPVFSTFDFREEE